MARSRRSRGLVAATLCLGVACGWNETFDRGESSAERPVPIVPEDRERGAPIPPKPPALSCEERSAPFDFRCDGNEDRCSLCLLGSCIGADLMPERFAQCGDGLCDSCEAPCAADCEEPPLLRGGGKNFDPSEMPLIHVGGFQFQAYEDWLTKVYGRADPGAELGAAVREFTGRPDGTIFPHDPTQVVEIDYYGAIAPPWMSIDDALEVEASPYDSPAALHRFALIVAKFIRHRLELTGAEHAGVSCHSMGCHLTRYLIENDLEGIASDELISRWATNAGVIAGARLAQLYDNPTVRSLGAQIGMNTFDFIHMHPDYVREVSAVWDHDLYAANNPLFRGIFVHHLAATKELLTASTGLPVSLLAVANPRLEPNDGVVYVADMRFHRQDPSNHAVGLNGERLAPSTSYLYFDHIQANDVRPAGALLGAALTGDRRVRVTLTDVRVLDDLERAGAWDFSNTGRAPAELVAESRVDHHDVVFHETRLVDRTLPIHEVHEDELATLNQVLFEGPVYVGQTVVRFTVRLLEVDRYPRLGLDESPIDRSRTFLSRTLELPLTPGELMVSNDRIEARLRVEVISLF